jgi:hypothetical protein
MVTPVIAPPNLATTTRISFAWPVVIVTSSVNPNFAHQYSILFANPTPQTSDNVFPIAAAAIVAGSASPVSAAHTS